MTEEEFATKNRHWAENLQNQRDAAEAACLEFQRINKELEEKFLERIEAVRFEESTRRKNEMDAYRVEREQTEARLGARITELEELVRVMGGEGEGRRVLLRIRKEELERITRELQD